MIAALLTHEAALLTHEAEALEAFSFMSVNYTVAGFKVSNIASLGTHRASHRL